MIHITFIDHLQQATTVQAEPGTTVMQAAVDHNIAGIVGECGGFCSCATCVCQVAEGWTDKLAPADDMELAMLDSGESGTLHHRLSCQIKLDASLNGLTVHLPQSQY
jgi:2Fe-2S ferredoxin